MQSQSVQSHNRMCKAGGEKKKGKKKLKTLTESKKSEQFLDSRIL